VKGSEKREVELTLGVPARQLEGGLHRLGSRISEIDAMRLFSRSQRSQLLGQTDLRGVIKVGAGHVQQLIGLGFDGCYDPGMAVAGRVDCDPGRKIQEAVAVQILDPEPSGPVDHQRVGTGVRGRNIGGVQLNEFLGTRARQRGAAPRASHGVPSGGWWQVIARWRAACLDPAIEDVWSAISLVGTDLNGEGIRPRRRVSLSPIIEAVKRSPTGRESNSLRPKNGLTRPVRRIR